MLGRKQRHQVVRSFPNRYLFSLTNKVTCLFPISCILEIILVCETPDSGAKTFQLIVISGFKAGAKYYQFPEESLPKDRSRYGLSTHWLRDNWYKYGYIDCPLEDVYIYESQVPTKFEL